LAHVLTRIDGWELGTIIAKTADSSTGVPTVQTGTVRTGTYALQLVQNGVAPQALVYALTFTDSPAPGSGIPATTAFAAAAFRAWVRFSVLPDSTRRILAFRGVGPTDRTVVSLSSAGVLSMDGNLGPTLAANTWYEITVLYDSATGLASLQLDSGTGRVLVFNNITAASAGTVTQLAMGQTAALAVYTMFVDDIAIEAAASVASIDFPAAGAVYGLPLQANGLLSTDVWTPFGAATRWECCTGPHDGDTTYIAVSNAGERRQSFVQTIPAQVLAPINAVQFQQVVRKSAGLTGHLNRILIAATNTSVVGSFMELTDNNGDGTPTYSITYRLLQLNPFTGDPWLVEDLVAMVVGTYADPLDLGGFQRVSTVMAQVDVGVPAGGGGSDVPAGSDVVPVVEVREGYCVSVVFDPGGVQETDLSGYLTGSRPLRMEKDVLLRRYKANDGELEFADPASLFVETNPASFLRHPVDDRPDWFNKRVEVQAQFGNSVLVRFVGFVVDVTAERGVGRLTIANRFQALVDRPVRANTMGRLVSTLRFPGIGPAEILDLNAPDQGLFLGTIGGQGNGVAGLNGPPAQTFTVNFLENGINTDFTVTGSVTGFEGRGRMELAGSWQSATGYLDIDPRRAGGDFKDPALGPKKGETATFEVLWRPTPGQGIIGAIREFLLDPLGAGLTPADLALDTFTALEGTVHDQVLPNIGAPVVPRLAATEGNVLDALAAMVLHAGCSLFETSDARIGLASFMPRTVTSIPLLCKSDDLMAAAVGHLPIYNEFAVLRTFDERNQKYTSGETWPPLVDNDSQVRYGRRLPAPSGLEFRGYDGSNEPWTKTVAQVLYERHKDPRTIFAVRTKIERLDAELDDVYRLDSEAPDIQVRFTDPAMISKSITGPLTVDMEVISTEVVSDGECPGFLALDDPGKGLDDPCWGLF